MNMDQDDRHLWSAWALRLAAEHGWICDELGVRLSRPTIEISRTKTVCGSWDPDAGVIAISVHVIRSHPWQVALMVLRHEMAHQYCSEVLGCEDGGHGREFRIACEMLMVAEAFRGARGPLPPAAAQLYRGGRVAQDSPLLAKVEKLFALASSANEHEAALAMNKANELLARHHLEWLEGGGRHEYAVVTINRRRKRIEGWQKRICMILRDFFFVQPIITELYAPEIDDCHRVIELFGRPEDVRIAEHCYSFLAERIETLWQRHRGRFSSRTRVEKKSFTLGLLAGFHDKLRAEDARRRQAAAPADTTLPAVGVPAAGADPDLAHFISQHHPRLRTTSRRTGSRVYRSTYEQGRAEGRKIVLHKVVGGDAPGGRPPKLCRSSD